MVSLLGIGLSAALWLGLPWYFICKMCPRIPKVINLLALMGMYAFFTYLKPKAIPLEMVASLMVVFPGIMAVIRKEAQKVPGIFCTLSGCAIVGYCFLLFFFRWEPPGTDPIKWGSLARLIEETGTVPGDTRPLAPVTDLKSAFMGVPIVVAILHTGGFNDWERLLNFSECLALCLFVFGMASALEIWFEKSVAEWASFLALVLFTVPQQYLAWGGTPTLLGATAGFTLLSFLRQLAVKPTSFWELTLYGWAVAFAAYAHPIGFAVSILVCFPVALSQKVPGTFLLPGIFLLSALFFSPFFLRWSFGVSEKELNLVWAWQKQMSPFLFRTEYGWVYNMYIQLSSYVWNTAAWISMFLLAFGVLWGRRKILLPFLWMSAMVIILVDNVRSWWLPFSFLLYPERVATLWVFPLSLALAWLVETFFVAAGRRRPVAGVFLLAIGILCVRQFQSRLLPLLFHSDLALEDKAAMKFIQTHVPKDDCIEIHGKGSGTWTAVLAFRCTVPFHGLGMNSLDEETASRTPKWRYESFSQVKSPPSNGTVAFDNGAKVIRLNVAKYHEED